MIKFDLPCEYCNAYVELRRSDSLDWDEDKFKRFKQLHREYCENGYSNDEKWNEYDEMIEEINDAGNLYIRGDNFEIVSCGQLEIEPDLIVYIDDSKPHPKTLSKIY